ncbi:venom acid phosphatase Acph-1 isoform X1 [Nilaparvata lugens]|uniref:venom acid phosphatase Acph-1 isoform X1 n=1 Tax=Nilaparvata lugens TaxID=108931 RepID=UPI00193D65F5|nr:venom acid phosphatase Acph-1 isoform X1 [Nilaparvata lugens]
MFYHDDKQQSFVETSLKNRGKHRSSVADKHLVSNEATAAAAAVEVEGGANFNIMATSSKFTVFGITVSSIIIVIISCFLFNTNASETTASSLRLVVAVFRHGERTPASTYPNDPHINNEFFPMGWGALTNEGKKNQYEIGKLLRTRYKSFLSDIYSPKHVVAQSTDVDRTKMSMQLVLAALFPPTEAQKWNNDLNWQPIPFKYEPLDQDKLLLVNIPCPRYYEALQEVVEREEVKTLIKQNEQIYELLTNKSGMEVKTFNDLLSMQGTLKAETDLNLKLPNWTEKVFPEPLNQLAGKAFTLNAYTPELRRIKGGPLLKDILTHMIDKIKKPTHKKEQLYLYAGHDSTIAHLLNALGVWEQHAPEYNALILLELHELKRDDPHVIKVFFRKSKVHRLEELTPFGCEKICTLNEILRLKKDVLPDDLMKDCMPKDPKYVPPKAPEI